MRRRPAASRSPPTSALRSRRRGLFWSTDRGETFELVRSSWDHPHRPEWQAGAGGQAIHTVLPHPEDPDQVESWVTVAEHLPDVLCVRAARVT